MGRNGVKSTIFVFGSPIIFFALLFSLKVNYKYLTNDVETLCNWGTQMFVA
jgi:hypothetical protein